MDTRCIILLLIVYTLCGHYCAAQSSDVVSEVEKETKLYKYLFDEARYAKALRPATTPDTTINVTISFTITRIEDLDEREHSLTTSMWIHQSWNDPRLSWNVTVYGGVSLLVIPLSHIWYPDLSLYNTASPGVYFEDMTSARAHLTNDGTVIWVPSITAKSYCSMNLKRFPRDSQTCKLVMGSWTFPTNKVKFQIADERYAATLMEESFHEVEHPSWNIVDGYPNVQINTKKYPCCPETYDVITLNFAFNRKSEYYDTVVIGPCVLLALLVPVIFIVPVTYPEKTTIGMPLIIAWTLVLTILHQFVPPSYSFVPRIVMFCMGGFVLTTMGVISAAIVASIAKKSSRPRPVPAWASRLFLGRGGLRKLLCLGEYTPPLSTPDYLTVQRENDFSDLAEAEGSAQELTSVENKELMSIYRQVRVLVDRFSAHDDKQKVYQDWVEVARVVDRALLVVFLILFSVIALSLLP